MQGVPPEMCAVARHSWVWPAGPGTECGGLIGVPVGKEAALQDTGKQTETVNNSDASAVR